MLEITLQVKQIISLIRVKHWIKNLILFLPLFFAGKIELAWSTPVITSFLCFCLASSGIYILNDLKDVEHDKVNPRKQHRPLAAGHISEGRAKTILAVVLGLLIIIASIFFHEAHYFILAYFVLNIFYTYKLKQIAIIDVTCISLGFILRILTGSVAAGVFLTHWMVIMVFLLMMSIAFAKRRDDFKIQVEKHLERKSKAGYTLQFLDMATTLSFAITLVAYIMYTVSPEVIERVGSDKIYVTGLFVFLGVMRYLQLTMVFGKSSSPVKILLSDRFIQLILLLWLFTFAFIIYG